MSELEKNSQFSKLAQSSEATSVDKNGQRKKRYYRRARLNTQRAQFASSLFNACELKDLVKWQHDKPHTEQKRFLASLDALYAGHQSALAEKANRTLDECGVEHDKVSARPTPLQKLTGDKDLYKAPPTLKPIDVFLRKRFRKMRHIEDGDIEGNFLQQWCCDSEHGSECTDSSSITEFSMLSATSKNSNECHQIPHNLATYQRHKRAFAINTRTWKNVKMHEPQGKGAASMGFPPHKQFETSYMRDNGRNPSYSGMSDACVDKIINPKYAEGIKNFLNKAPQAQKEQCMNILRSVQTHSEHDPYQTAMKRQFDLKKATEYWKPKQGESKDPALLYQSSVPLGTLHDNLNWDNPDYEAFDPNSVKVLFMNQQYVFYFSC